MDSEHSLGSARKYIMDDADFKKSLKDFTSTEDGNDTTGPNDIAKK
jgi:hypothetical protein